MSICLHNERQTKISGEYSPSPTPSPPPSPPPSPFPPSHLPPPSPPSPFPPPPLFTLVIPAWPGQVSFMYSTFTYTVSPLHDTNLPISLSLHILYICTRTCMQETSQSTYCLVLFIRYFIYGTFGYAVAHKRSSGSFGDAVTY